MEDIKYKSNLKILHVLLVISFIVSGYCILAYLQLGIALPFMTEQVADIANHVPEFGILLDKMLAIPRWYFLIASLLNVASVVGLILMWKLRGNGFHCYTMSKLLLMLMPVIFLDRSYIGVGDIMLSILFIVYYFVLLRMLGAFNKKNVASNEESDINITNDSKPSTQEDEK